MKLFIVFLSTLFYASNLQAQVGKDYIYLGDDVQSTSCDTSQIERYTYWRFYQTVDDTPFGNMVDSCLSLDDTSIDYHKLVGGKKLFFRSKRSLDSFEIIKNWIYNLDVSLGSNKLVFDTTITPMLLFMLQDKDSIIDIDTSYTLAMPLEYSHNGCAVENSICYPTKKYDQQKLKSIIIEVPLLASVTAQNAKIEMDKVSAIMGYGINAIDTLLPIEYSSNTNPEVNVYFAELIKSFFFSNLIVHTKGGIPSIANQDLKLLRLTPNPSDVKTVNITVDKYDQLYFQEFTGFDTEYAQGSQEKHRFNLIMDGGSLCLEYVELIMQDNSNFYFRSGVLDFGDVTACINIRKGSNMIVDDNAYFRYGEGGNGMLAMYGGDLNIQSKATLIFDGSIQCIDTAHVYLEEGAELIFGSKAKINTMPNHASPIIIHGSRKQVNMQELDPRYSDYILFSETATTEHASKVLAYPNPVSDVLYLSENNDGKEYKIINAVGKVVKRGIYTEDGIDVLDLVQGMYVLCIKGEGVSNVIKL